MGVGMILCGVVCAQTGLVRVAAEMAANELVSRIPAHISELKPLQNASQNAGTAGVLLLYIPWNLFNLPMSESVHRINGRGLPIYGRRELGLRHTISRLQTKLV